MSDGREVPMKPWWKAEEPLSTVTAAFYPLVGLILVALYSTPEAWVMAVALVWLGLGTAVHHYRGAEPGTWMQDLDHAGMNATYIALAVLAVGGPWWVMLLAALAAAVVVEYVLDHPNYVLMVVTVLLAVVAGLGGGEPVWTALGVVLMVAGGVLWQAEESFGLRPDASHAAWHVLTAAGTLFLYAGVI